MTWERFLQILRLRNSKFGGFHNNHQMQSTAIGGRRDCPARSMQPMTMLYSSSDPLAEPASEQSTKSKVSETSVGTTLTRAIPVYNGILVIRPISVKNRNSSRHHKTRQCLALSTQPRHIFAAKARYVLTIGLYDSAPTNNTPRKSKSRDFSQLLSDAKRLYRREQELVNAEPR